MHEGVPSVDPQGSVLGQLLIAPLINYLEGNIKLLLAKFAGDTKADVYMERMSPSHAELWSS